MQFIFYISYSSLYNMQKRLLEREKKIIFWMHFIVDRPSFTKSCQYQLWRRKELVLFIRIESCSLF